MAINLTSNCLLQYKMNDNDESFQVDDTSDNGNHGTLREGGPPGKTEDHSVTGKIDKALEFDGTNDYIDLTSVVNLSGFWTITFFSYLDDNTGRPNIILGKNHPTQSYIHLTGNMTPEIRFCNDTGSYATWTGIPALHQQWRQLTFVSTNDGAKLHLFIDNVWQSSKDIYTNFKIISVAIGLGDSYNRFKGKLDCLNVFDKNLYDDERDFLWNNGDGTERLRSPACSLVGSSLVGNSLVGKGLS